MNLKSGKPRLLRRSGSHEGLNFVNTPLRESTESGIRIERRELSVASRAFYPNLSSLVRHLIEKENRLNPEIPGHGVLFGA